jgi:hypothetical protein
MMSYILKLSDCMSAVENVLGFFDILLWVRLCMGMEKYTPKSARFLCTVRIVALRSVNKIFQESYDFAATLWYSC